MKYSSSQVVSREHCNSGRVMALPATKTKSAIKVPYSNVRKHHWHKNYLAIKTVHFWVPIILTLETSRSAKPLRIKKHFHINGFALSLVLKQRLGVTRKWPMERFHMTLRRPYWCSKTMKQSPHVGVPNQSCGFFLMETLSFVPVNLYGCCPREWKRSIGATVCTWCVTFHTWRMNTEDGKTFHQESHDRLQKTVISPLLLRCRWMQTKKRKKKL